MLLFLRQELVKSEGAPKQKAGADKPVSPNHGAGAQRGGQYVAREQIGFETDGSPKYRYFKTEEEHEAFIKHRGEAKGAQGLKAKVSKEHTESVNKVKGSAEKAKDDKPEPKKHGLLSKSLSLYVRY